MRALKTLTTLKNPIWPLKNARGYQGGEPGTRCDLDRWEELVMARLTACGWWNPQSTLLSVRGVQA